MPFLTRQCFGRTFALVAAINSAAHAVGDSVLAEWPVTAGGNGHWYELVDFGSSSSIDVAEFVAETRAGSIVAVESTAELDFLRSILTKQSLPMASWCAASRRPQREPQLLDATSNALGWIRDARTDRLVDLVLIGDSNIGFSASGWEHGLQHALHASGIPCAAIGPTPFNDDGGTIGWRCNKYIGSLQQWPSSLGNYDDSDAHAPSALQALMNFPNGYPNTGCGYAWLSSGSASIAGGLILHSNHPFIQEAAPFEFRLQYGVLPGGGHFTPTAWRIGSLDRVVGSVVACNGKRISSAETTLAIPSGFAAGNALRLTIDDSNGVLAPFFLGWSSVERTDISHGSCVSVLDWHGGATTETLASDVESFTSDTAALWVQTMRARQLRHGSGVRVLFVLCSGMNDFGITTAAHEAALRRQIVHLSTRWSVGGGSASEIGFVLMTSHDPSISEPTARFLAFRAVGRAIAAERTDTAAIDLGAIPMQNVFYSGSSSGSPHLTPFGYERMSELIIEALDGSQGAACEWRWSSGMFVNGVSIDDADLEPCRRALAALVPSASTGVQLRGVTTDAMLRFALIEYDADCDGDGVVDRGAVASGLVEDLNGNAVPDACECKGDMNKDGFVDSRDLAVLLNSWGQTGSGADVDGSGIIDAVDLTIMLAQWGDCSR